LIIFISNLGLPVELWSCSQKWSKPFRYH